MLKKMIKIVKIKINKELPLAKFARYGVILEVVCLIETKPSLEKVFIILGTSKKVIATEIKSPKVIINPKSITGLISLKTSDKNAQIVVKAV